MINKLRKDRTTRKGLIRKLDKIVSEIVRLRDGACFICGTKENLCCGHLFSRVAYSTRWDLNNVFASCYSCNFRNEFDPYPMMNKVIELRGIEFVDDLHRQYETPVILKDFHLKEMYEQLLTVKKTLEQ